MNATYSIITICFNAKTELELTINSVLEQVYKNYEFIVIDGNSKDGTKEIINKYNKYISIAISEPDKGIYDAMNKGIRLASGKWIIFMNAGDTFFNKNVLSDVSNYLDKNYDIIYGSAEIKTSFAKYIQEPLSIDQLSKKMIFCHQSCFIKTEYHKNNPFDISYKSSGDYHFFYTAYIKNHCKFKQIPVVVSIFDAIHGISSTKFLQPKKENLRVWGKDKNIYSVLGMYCLVFVSYLRYKIMSFLPQSFANCIRKYKSKQFK